MPSARAWSARRWVASALRMTTGMSQVAGLARSSASTASPVMSGRFRSSRITSGRCWLARSSATPPSMAASTVTDGRWLRICSTSRRFSTMSSTYSTVRGAL